MKTFLKIVILIIFNFAFHTNIYAQTVYWRNIIGEQYNETGRDVIELRDKGILMVGEKEVVANGFSNLVYQTYLIKLDRYGNILWQKVLGDSLNANVSLCVAEDLFGNIFIPYGNLSQARLIKMDSTGTIMWDKNFPTTEIAYFTGISFVDNFKNIMLVGANHLSSIYTSSLTKIDSSGKLIWNKAYYDSIPTISSYSSYSNCYLFTDNFYFFCGEKGINGFVIKTDTSGVRIWTRRYTGSQYILSIVKNSDNTFIATGIARNWNTYCVKFDLNGDTIWTKSDYVETFGDKKIVRIYNGNFAIGTVGGGNITRIGIIDSTGNVISTYSNFYPSNVLLSHENLNVTSDSGLILTGNYSVYPFSSHPIDAIIFKVDKFGNMVYIKNTNEIILDEFVFTTFPNPYNSSFELSFQLNHTSNVGIEFYNILGKKLREIENKYLYMGQYRIVLSTPELSTGVYFLRLHVNGKNYTKKILLMK